MDGQTVRNNELDKVVDFLEENRLFRGVVLLSEKGKPVYERAVGKRNGVSQHSRHSVFEIASISKSFTALATMILVEEGRLRLEDSLERFFPFLPYKSITIENLLNHTSGLPDYIEWFEEGGNWNPQRVATNADVVGFLKEEQPEVLFEPSEKWEYCNTGYVLLAEIIESVSGMEYGAFLKRRIFEPLRMFNTSTNSQFLDEELDNFSQGYIYDWEEDLDSLPNEMEEHRYVYFLDGVKGDGGIKSTADDLLKWERCLYHSELVSQQTKERMLTPVRVNGDTKTCASLHEDVGGYGFGWKLEHHPQYQKIVLHDGYWAGYCTGLIHYNDYDKAIIMLSNLDFTNPKLNKVPHLLTLTLERIVFGGQADLQEFEHLIMQTRI